MLWGLFFFTNNGTRNRSRKWKFRMVDLWNKNVFPHEWSMCFWGGGGREECYLQLLLEFILFLSTHPSCPSVKNDKLSFTYMLHLLTYLIQISKYLWSFLYFSSSLNTVIHLSNNVIWSLPPVGKFSHNHKKYLYHGKRKDYSFFTERQRKFIKAAILLTCTKLQVDRLLHTSWYQLQML